MYIYLIMGINISAAIILLIAIAIRKRKWLAVLNIVWILGFFSLMLLVIITNKEQVSL